MCCSYTSTQYAYGVNEERTKEKRESLVAPM